MRELASAAQIRRCVVYVVAKAPRPGTSKTRLCPPLDPNQAAHLAGAFLLDVLESVRHAGLDARIICRDHRERDALEQFVPPGIPVQVQFGAGLGGALESAFQQGLASGYHAVAAVSADCPTLPPDLLRRAFTSLQRGADVALGPSEDGGYYLIGARACYPWLFDQMAWSTSSVLAVTLERCISAGLRTDQLPVWYDVDDATSLARLAADLEQAPERVARFTRAALASMPLPSSLTSRSSGPSIPAIA